MRIKTSWFGGPTESEDEPGRLGKLDFTVPRVYWQPILDSLEPRVPQRPYRRVKGKYVGTITFHLKNGQSLDVTLVVYVGPTLAAVRVTVLPNGGSSKQGDRYRLYQAIKAAHDAAISRESE